MDREFKAIPALITKEIEDRTVEGIAAVTGNLDTYADVIHRGAFRKTIQEGTGRIRHLWQHDWMMPPIATIKELREVGRDDLPDRVRTAFPDATGGLLVARRYLDTQRGDEVLSGIVSGAINEMSIGFNPVKFDFEEIEDGELKGLLVRNLREVRLWDTSDVNWGANSATVASKAAVPYRDTGTADESEDWSRPALKDFTDESWDDLSEAERRRVAAHFAWAANDPPEAYGDLKLPHHRPSKSGIGPAVWNGGKAAMGALLGARGGTDIPDGDRRAVYNHLKRHYDQFEKEAPDFKLVEMAGVLGVVQRELAGPDARLQLAGMVDGGQLAEKLCELQEILRAEPPAHPAQALTPNAVLARLEIAKRELIALEE